MTLSMLGAARWDFRFVYPAEWLLLWLLAAAAGAWLLYRRDGSSLSKGTRLLLAGLRACSLGLVLSLLFEPVLATLHSKSQEAVVAVLVDTSKSMTMPANEYQDPADRLAAGRLAGLVDASVKEIKAGTLPPQTEAALKALTRLQTVEGILNDRDLAFLKRLEALHTVKLYAFDAGAVPVAASSAAAVRMPPAEGNSSRLGDALRRIQGEWHNRLAGIVLMTDGRSNAGEDPEVSAKALADRKPPVPVYAVGIGESAAARDVALGNLLAPAMAIRGGDDIRFQARLTATGFEGQRATVTLSRGDTEVKRTEIVLPKDGEDLPVALVYKPGEEGSFSFRMAVLPVEGELVTENNSVVQTVKVVSGKIRVCYLDERPRWEYRKLVNFLKRNAETYASSCLLFSATDDFKQEGTHKISRFYRDYKELAESTDVLILGDVDPAHFNAIQMDAIVKFCETGGGVIFESGEESMPSAYHNTPLGAKLMPMRPASENWERRIWLEAITETFRMKLSTRGEAHPLMRILEQEEENRRYWEELQGQYWFFPIEQLKPVAVPLAVHPVRKNRQGEPYPLAVTMNFGRGQIFFLAFDSTWRWSYMDPGDSSFQRFWAKAIQQLGSNRMKAGSEHAMVSTDHTDYAQGDRVLIRASVLDANYDPVKQDSVKVTVLGPDRLPQGVSLSRNSDSGDFEGTWTANRPGDHEVTLDPASVQGVSSGRTPFTVRTVTAEFQDPRMDRGALERIAQLTGGAFYTPRDLTGLVERIAARSEDLVTEERRPLWDHPATLCLLVALLCAEWILRKWLRLI